MMVKPVWLPMAKVPELLVTLNCAGGGVQESVPEAVAVNPPAAVALAAGFGCDWQAATGVVAGVVTVTVTELCAAIAPSEQLSTLLFSVQEPCEGVAVAHVRPPLVGSVSFRLTLLADWLPAAAGLLTVMVKPVWLPMVKVPEFFVTASWAGGGAIVTEQLAVPVAPLLSVTVTLYVKVPFVFGVPEMVPSVPIVKLPGSPVWANV